MTARLPERGRAWDELSQEMTDFKRDDHDWRRGRHAAFVWHADEAVFSVDSGEVRRCPRPPTYPLQLMVAVYDFPEWSVGDDDHLVPELVVDRIAG